MRRGQYSKWLTGRLQAARWIARAVEMRVGGRGAHGWEPQSILAQSCLARSSPPTQGRTPSLCLTDPILVIDTSVPGSDNDYRSALPK